MTSAARDPLRPDQSNGVFSGRGGFHRQPSLHDGVNKPIMMRKENFETPRSGNRLRLPNAADFRRWIASEAWRLAVLGLVSVLLPWVGILSAAVFLPGRIEALGDVGIWLCLPFVVVAGILVGFALAPTHLSSLVSGFLFGTFVGTLAALFAVGLGSFIGYRIARNLAEDRLRTLVDRSKWGRVLASEWLDVSPWRAVLAVGLARLPPQVPFAMGNLVAASVKVPLLPTILGTMAGMLPRVALVAWMGAELSVWKPGASIPNGFLWALVCTVAGLGGLALGCWYFAKHRKAGKGDPVSDSHASGC